MNADTTIGRRCYIKKETGQIEYVFGSAICALFYAICAIILVFSLPQLNRVTGLFYILVVTGSILFAAASQRSRGSIASAVFLLLSFCMMYFPLGLRNASGIDDITYYNHFLHAGILPLWEYIKSSEMEIGYKLLAYMIYQLTEGNYFLFQAICSFIPIALFYVGFWKYSDRINLPLAILLLFGTLYFQMLAVSLVRMLIALSIAFLSYEDLLENKKIQFSAKIILASLFHISALILLGLLLLVSDGNGIFLNWKRFIAGGLLAIPVLFVFAAKFVVPILGDRYMSYAELGSFQLTADKFDMLPFWILGIYFLPMVTGKAERLYTLGLVLISFSMIFSVYSSIVSLGRLIFYANLGHCFVLPVLSSYLKRKNHLSHILIVCLVIAYSFLYLWTTQWGNLEHSPFLFPYQNVFFTL